MRRCLLGGLALLASAISFAAPDYVIESFPGDQVPDYWHFRGVKATKVKDAVKLVYPKYVEGEDMWPASIIDFGKGGFTSKDWSNHKYLAFYVFFESEKDSIIMLRLDDTQKNIVQETFELKANELNVFAIATERLAKRGLNLKEVCHFDMFMERLKEDHVLIFHGVKLSDQPYPKEVVDKWIKETLDHLEKAQKQVQKVDDGKQKNWLLEQIAEKIEFLKSNATIAEKLDFYNGDWLAAFPDRVRRLEFYKNFANAPYVVTPIPTTLKLMPDQVPPQHYGDDLMTLHAAKGDAESVQLLVANGSQKLAATIDVTEFVSEDGKTTLKPELSPVGFIPVANPTPRPYGFGTQGLFPDVLLPTRQIKVEPFQNQPLWLSVWVPEDGKPGIYKATVTITPEGDLPKKQIPIALKVYNVTLPRHGKLHTCWVWQDHNTDKWFKGDHDEFLKLNLKYRFDLDRLISSASLPWNKVFSVDENGKVTANWKGFDERYEYWWKLGKNTFNGYSAKWFGYGPMEKQINVDVETQKLRLAVQHLKEKGWIDNFYTYVFDEPPPSHTEGAKGILRFFKDAVGHDAHIILTACHPNLSDYEGLVSIWTPHINLYDTEYLAKRQAAGDHAWMYTCIGTVRTTYPDTWRLDNYGTGHRAVGWWLFKYNVEGYLYWGVNYWQSNPWADAMTFPNGNGDGSMFYPDPERKALPFPSIRAEIVRDGFEDYELLHLLKEKYEKTNDPEIKSILQCNEIIYDTKHYNQLDDLKYIQLHKRILELLEK